MCVGLDLALVLRFLFFPNLTWLFVVCCRCVDLLQYVPHSTHRNKPDSLHSRANKLPQFFSFLPCVCLCSLLLGPPTTILQLLQVCGLLALLQHQILAIRTQYSPLLSPQSPLISHPSPTHTNKLVVCCCCRTG